MRNVHTLTRWSSALPSHVLQGLIKAKSLPTPGRPSRYIRSQGLSWGTLDQGTTERCGGEDDLLPTTLDQGTIERCGGEDDLLPTTLDQGTTEQCGGEDDLLPTTCDPETHCPCWTDEGISWVKSACYHV